MPDRLPNAEQARINPRKLRDYALNPEHDLGQYKAAFFAELVTIEPATQRKAG
jgi:hypothetical protein